jgi:anti-sigma factor RsiW
VSGHERERLSAYLDGELAPAERAEVEAHLSACPECSALLARLAEAGRLAAQLGVEAPEGYFDALPGRVAARLEARRRPGEGPPPGPGRPPPPSSWRCSRR